MQYNTFVLSDGNNKERKLTNNWLWIVELFDWIEKYEQPNGLFFIYQGYTVYPDALADELTYLPREDLSGDMRKFVAVLERNLRLSLPPVLLERNFTEFKDV